MSIKPYEGNEKYIFVSYAHKDSAIVLPILEQLKARGCRIWCDDKLIAGENYNAAIARHLRDCDAVLFFLSENWMQSVYCRSEATVGIEQFQKKVALLYLESCTTHDEVLMLFAGKHTIRMSDPQYFDKLLQSPALRDCIGQSETEQEPPADDRLQQLLALANTPEGKAMLEALLGKTADATITTPSPAPKPEPKASEGLEYALSEDGSSYVIKAIGTCEDTEIVIPRTYQGKPVTSIGGFAFSCCSFLRNITIPDGVTSIGYHAFHCCKALTSITIPNSVTSLGCALFESCLALTEIHYNGTKNDWIGMELISGPFGYTDRYSPVNIYCTNGAITIPGRPIW